MSERRDQIIERIRAERERQHNLPGAEWDSRNGPNDWVAIASSYCLQGARRKNLLPNSDEFESDLVKAAVVILAALENVEVMKKAGTLSSSSSDL